MIHWARKQNTGIYPQSTLQGIKELYASIKGWGNGVI